MFSIKICALKKKSDGRGDGLNGEETRGQVICSLIYLLLSTCYVVGTVLNAGYTEVDKASPHGREVYILVGGWGRQ